MFIGTKNLMDLYLCSIHLGEGGFYLHLVLESCSFFAMPFYRVYSGI